MNLLVHASIPAIHVAGDIRADGGVIQGGVKQRPLVGRAPGDLHSFQLPFPERLGLRHRTVEIPIWNFRLQIPSGSGDIHRADPDFDQHLFVVRRGELQLGLHVFARRLPAVGLQLVVHIQLGFKRFGEHRVEVDPTVWRPSRNMPPSGNLPVAKHFQLRLNHLPVLDAMLEIHNHAGLRGLRKGVAMNAGPGRGGQLRLDLITVQKHPIVSRCRRLFFLPE